MRMMLWPIRKGAVVLACASVVGAVQTMLAGEAFVVGERQIAERRARGPQTAMPAGMFHAWPMYGHDAARSSVTSEEIEVPLFLHWVHVPRHVPDPAWPDPERELHRMSFDYAFQVAAADGSIYFGSSADNKVYALDAATGVERWSFFTGGPLRFAPAVWKDRVFAASDDGWLYSLSAADGGVIWKYRGGPRDDKLLGNERMISRWPLRSGLVIDQGIVYFAAGMWPSEGVYMMAVRAEDGKEIWKTGGAGGKFAAQGELILSEKALIAPTGRGAPATFDRQTGACLDVMPDHVGVGGSWVAGSGSLIFCEERFFGLDWVAAMGKPREGQPTPGDGLAVWECRGSRLAKRFSLPGKSRAVVSRDTVYAAGSGEVSAYDLKGLRGRERPTHCVKWEIPCDCRYALILVGRTLFAGGQDRVVAINAADGNVLWSGTVHAQARGLAVADGRLFVSTSTGQIACFAPNEVANPARISAAVDPAPYPQDELTPRYAELAERIVRETGITRGYCLDYGAGEGRLAFELAKRTDLKICCLEPDPAKVAAARKALDAAGLYGVRITVDQGRLNQLPYASYFADLIVSARGVGGDSQATSADELYRVLRPCGGVAYLTAPLEYKDGSAENVENWLQR